MNDTPLVVSQGNDPIDNPVTAREGIVEARDALAISMDDTKFVEVANKLIRDSQSFYNQKYQLEKRQEKNETYYFGRQLESKKIPSYNARFVDNILYESMTYKKAMAMSRPPDLVVKPGEDTDDSKQTAAALSKALTSDIKSRDRKKVLSMAYMHRPVYFFGALKPFWNPAKGKYGDYDFRTVFPKNLVLDHTSPTKNVDDMQFVAEAIEYSVIEWIMRFPKKKTQFIEELYNTGIFNSVINEKTEAGMNSKVKGWEIWFTNYDKVGDSYERQECVGWFYNRCVLDKMKDPNWDWEGTPQTFKYDKEPSYDQLADSLLTKDFGGYLIDKVFHNYFESPRKPYIIIGYDQWGKTPIDETSEIEQSILLQDNYDKRGAQITDMLNRSRGKHIFSSDSGLKAEDLEEMDMNNPDEDLLIKGKVNEVHAFIPGEQITPALIEDKKDLRERIFDKMGVHGPARGEVDNGTAATNNQISREGDYSRSDDVTDDTINDAAEQMAQWIMQFIKLRYTQDHFMRILGDDGKTLFLKLHRDMIEDGMEVSVSASGTDKLRAQQNATDSAKLQMSDPISYYTDMNMSDPKGRAAKLVAWMLGPAMYAQQYVQNSNVVGGMTDGLNNTPEGQAGQGVAQAQADIQSIMQGQVPPPPQQVDPGYMQAFTAWAQDPNGMELFIRQHPELQQQVLQFAQAVSARGKSGGQPQEPQPAAGTPIQSGTQPAPQPPAPGPIGQVGSNPSPQNTSRVALAS